MKKLTKQVSILLILTFFTGLTYAQVSSEYDKSVDFSEYKTFTFAPWQAGSDKVLNDIDKNTIQTSLTSELAARGITKEDSTAGPALYVTIYIVIKNEQSTTAYTTFNGGLGMGYGVGWGYGMGAASTTYSEDDYQEGTAVLDFYDFKTKKLLWQGTIQGVVKSESKRDKTIPKKVSELMERYPVNPTKN
jgi:hypothetical protein